MKAFALLLLLAAAALAQVPAHSVVGSLTLDVSDVVVAVPYGPSEAKAVVSVCDTQESQRFQITINSQESPDTIYGLYYDIATTKAGDLYCGSVVATVPRASILSVDVQHGVHFAPPPPTAGSTGVSSSVRVQRQPQRQ